MLLRLGRRAIGMVTGFFALLGFVAVPIGDRTGYEHVKQALETPEGREAVAAVGRAYVATRDRLLTWAADRLKTTASINGTNGVNAFDPKALLDRRRDRDAVDTEGPAPSFAGPVVSHDEEGRIVSGSRSRKDTGIRRREERRNDAN